MRHNRLEWSKICLKAMQIAMAVLSDKLDKSGMTTFWHSLRVANKLKGWKLQTVALLHDCLEDGRNLKPDILHLIGVPQWLIDDDGRDLTFRKLKHLGIDDDEVLSALDSITRRCGESYGEYLVRVKSDPNARLVKLADIDDNMTVERLSYLPESKAVKMCHKYLKAMRYLRDIDDDGLAGSESYDAFIRNEFETLVKLDKL